MQPITNNNTYFPHLVKKHLIHEMCFRIPGDYITATVADFFLLWVTEHWKNSHFEIYENIWKLFTIFKRWTSIILLLLFVLSRNHRKNTI